MDQSNNIFGSVLNMLLFYTPLYSLSLQTLISIQYEHVITVLTISNRLLLRRDFSRLKPSQSIFFSTHLSNLTCHRFNPNLPATKTNTTTVAKHSLVFLLKCPLIKKSILSGADDTKPLNDGFNQSV
jgi:hypothetical protein